MSHIDDDHITVEELKMNLWTVTRRPNYEQREIQFLTRLVTGYAYRSMEDLVSSSSVTHFLHVILHRRTYSRKTSALALIHGPLNAQSLADIDQDGDVNNRLTKRDSHLFHYPLAENLSSWVQYVIHMITAILFAIDYKTLDDKAKDTYIRTSAIFCEKKPLIMPTKRESGYLSTIL